MIEKSKNDFSAYGGKNWRPREKSHRAEIGSLWRSCGIDSEWMPLQSVLLHQPGIEWETLSDPNDAQMLSVPDVELASQQHTCLADAYREAGVTVHYVDPDAKPPPNLIFCADLFFMTPEGAILARPASSVRAGEERWVARRLADLGIPILKTLRANAVFEGADALWVDHRTVLIGKGIRTNRQGVDQVCTALHEMGVVTMVIDLPIGSMHLMGMVRFLDSDLAVAWNYRLAWSAVELLRERGFRVEFVPDENEASQNSAFNFVTLGPGRILIPANNPISQSFYQSLGIECHTVEISELSKAAGGIGCLTGILERALVHD
jgi:arginine deiminase